MADAAVTGNLHEPLDTHGHLAPEIALHLVLALEDLPDARGLLVAPVLDPTARIDVGLGEYLLRRGDADAVDVLDRDLTSFVSRQIYSGDTCHAIAP
jgi:hypothetical protein